MRKFILLFIVAALILFSGCCNLTLPGGQENQSPTNYTSPNQSPLQPAGQAQQNGTGAATGGQPVTDANGQGTIIDVGGSSGNGQATSQSDCATLTPTCNACVAKQGCGWCKSSNSCFFGDASGPKVSSCQDGEWAVTSSQCQAPVNGGSCSQKTNCADCLSGSGCKWCIQGSKCTEASDGDSCFGGWMTSMMQCNYASR